MQNAATVKEHDPHLFEQIKAGKLAADLAARKVRRTLRDQNLKTPPLPDGPFELIYADPPWQLGNPDSEYAPENHYPTMPLHEIKELQPAATENAVLFIWAVNCLLPQALDAYRAGNPHPNLRGIDYLRALLADQRHEERFWHLGG